MRQIKVLNCIIAATALILVSACSSSAIMLVNLPVFIDGGHSLYKAEYGTNPSQSLDIYVPDKSGYAKNDVIVFLHGGRWTTGSKKDYRFVGAALAKRGFVVVIPDYRQYPEIRFPVFVEDAAKAIAWVDDHIAEYGGSPEHIHLMGHSSGAHIGALLVADDRYLAKEGKNSRRVLHDFAGLAGPYVFTPDEKDLIDIFGPPENYPQMQVTTFIDGKEPPMLLLYGQDDDTVKSYNHEKLAATIRDKDGTVEVITYPGLSHIGLIGTFSILGPKSNVVEDITQYFRANDEH